MHNCYLFIYDKMIILFLYRILNMLVCLIINLYTNEYQYISTLHIKI